MTARLILKETNKLHTTLHLCPTTGYPDLESIISEIQFGPMNLY
jgi:hypothetical protein